jgi:TM2 domain-containing membrane protein YozV
MLVAPEHTRIAVTCPHCRHTLEPWRVMATVAGQHRAAGPGRLAPYDPTIYSTRNRWVAGALGILLGQFGVHRFYMGYVDIGILQIIVTLVTCGIGGIWGFIEGILCFCGAMQDVDGLPLRS